MGVTLSRAVQWSSGGSELEDSPLNKALLKEIARFTEECGARHPHEARLTLTEPLRWKTSLTASDFTEDYLISDESVVSKDCDKAGNPNLKLSPPDISVRILCHLSNILQLAGETKMNEVKACLEANREALMKICESHSDSVSETNLINLLHKLDEKLLGIAVKPLTRENRLIIKALDAAVNQLQSYCGQTEDGFLKSVRYTSDFVFSNHCRSPPWRQREGEICSVLVETCDAEPPLLITCTTSGVFLAQEDDTDVFEDIVTLLKNKSPHFAESINEQKLQEKKTHRSNDLKEMTDPIKMPPPLLRKPSAKKYNTLFKPDGLVTYEEDETKSSNLTGIKKILKPGVKSPAPVHKQRSHLSGSSLSGLQSSQKVKTPGGADDFSESSTESEEDEEQSERHTESFTDLNAERWQIQKLVKYLKGANQTATVIILCLLRDFNLVQETCQLAIRDVGGLELLINLLGTNEVNCKIGSLKILKEISCNSQIRHAIVGLGGLQTLVTILDSNNKELKCLAAETIANVAKFREARRTVRQYCGLKRLVGLLDCKPEGGSPSPEQEQDVEVARCGALALWSCSKSTKNKAAIHRAGGIPLLARLLSLPQTDILIPVVGTLQECASEASCCAAIQTEGLIKDLVTNLSCDNQELQMHCASAIFKCAEHKYTRDLVREYNGLKPLVSLLNKIDDKQLLAASTGAIWKCSISVENVILFGEYNAIDTLVGLLTDQPEEVIVNVAGALGECCQIRDNLGVIRRSGGIQLLINLLTRTNQALLVNVTKVVAACATDQENMTIIDSLDGIRLLWSLLKNPCQDVQASAAWAICPCIENAKDAGKTVLSFVGGLELLFNLLKSTNKEVLTSVCAAICKIAKDIENLEVITQFGLVPKLTNLTNTSDDKLRRHLAEAIACCCTLNSNCVAFGEAGAVAPLVHYLSSKDPLVHQATARALFELSKNPRNCITLHDNKAGQLLLVLIGSTDAVLQEAAAGCVANIRRLIAAYDKSVYPYEPFTLKQAKV